MLPQPPDLAAVIEDWSDAELFRIVKHGVRFTGMPAWPTRERDDEVWAMVAFLRELPGMDGPTYRGLAYGRQRPPDVAGAPFEAALAGCVRCHGVEGHGRSPAVPVLAGQSEAYLLESLRAYADGRRSSGIMALATSESDPEQWPALARHFAALSPGSAAPPTEGARTGPGEEIARHGRPAADVPACLGCHDAVNRNPRYPRLAGQPAAYIVQQLMLFRQGKRDGTAYGRIMTEVAKRLDDSDLSALAAYFSTLAPPD